MKQVSHVCKGYGLQRELKFSKNLYLESLKLFGPSSVSDKFGPSALDHLFLFLFVFILLSLVLWILTLGLDQVLSLLKVAHSLNQTQLLKQEIAKTHM